MSALRSDDGDASERELLVDDILRIREALRTSAGNANKLSSDEEDDEESEEEEEEDNELQETEEASLKSRFFLLFKYLSIQNTRHAQPCRTLPSQPKIIPGENTG